MEFQDATLPLVVDVGCGFGVSLLGLAAVEHRHRHAHRDSEKPDFGNKSGEGNVGVGGYNYLGCDLSSHCIAYASGMMCARQSMADFT